MGFQQNQITWATTTTGSDSNNYNRHRNLFRLVFSEQRSHEEEEEKEKEKISYQRDHLCTATAIDRTAEEWKNKHYLYEIMIAVANKT